MGLSSTAAQELDARLRMVQDAAVARTGPEGASLHRDLESYSVLLSHDRSRERGRRKVG